MQLDQSDSVGYWSADKSWQQVQSAWVQSSTTQWFLKTCAVTKQKLEYFDDRCIILIQLFGGYSVSEVLHAKVAGRMLGVACRMQRNSFLVEREC